MTSPSQTSAREFVDTHAGAVPPALVARVKTVLAAQSAEQQSAGASLIEASKTLLAGVIARPAAGREVALDLLAADACVTWAFEFEASVPDRLPTLAEGAMTTIGALAK